MDAPVTISYSFRFGDGATKEFALSLDRKDLNLLGNAPADPPEWTRLGHSRCENCTLSPTEHERCPVALNLTGIAFDFKDHFAHEPVFVTVKTEERTYASETTIQMGLSALIGIVMATSGCPVLDRFRPLVRFHLPFASFLEAFFRMASTVFLAQYYMQREGREVRWSLDLLEETYAEAGQVNRDFMQRMLDAAKKDANANALVNLDCFASLLPLTAEQSLAELKNYFFAYLR